MKAISLWQPWCWCIFDLPPDRRKDVENRRWAAKWMQGRFIAIHASGKVDARDTWEAIERLTGVRPPAAGAIDDQWRYILPRQAIVGVAEVLGFVTRSDSPWFSGPIGWQLGQRIRLAEPVPCRGGQGIWTVPPDVEAEVRAQLPRRRNAAQRCA